MRKFTVLEAMEWSSYTDFNHKATLVDDIEAFPWATILDSTKPCMLAKDDIIELVTYC